MGALVERSRDVDGWSPQGPVTELSDARSWLLIRGTNLGRIGLSRDNNPEIYPVYYYSDGDRIVFRTAAGTKLVDLASNDSVVFEVDAPTDDGTWSVIVHGTARILNDVSTQAAAVSSLPEWVPTEPYVFVEVTPRTIAGRWFHRRLRMARADEPDIGGPKSRSNDPPSKKLGS